MTRTAANPHPPSLYGRAAALAERILQPTVLLLVQRLGIASVFFLSGRTRLKACSR